LDDVPLDIASTRSIATGLDVSEHEEAVETLVPRAAVEPEVADLAEQTFDTWSVSTPETPSVSSEFMRGYLQQHASSSPFDGDVWQPQLLLEVSEMESEPRLIAPQAYVP
jgi:hypothetical protein